MEISKGKRTKRPRPYFEREATYFLIPKIEFSDEISVSTEEEEDMANCLILLAQGFFPKREKVDEGHEKKEAIYECKTCNKMFPSFQALGGHRASHKKSRADQKVEEVKKEQLGNFAPLQIHMAEIRHKVHECTICGSEFSSGQALGGHMRRHREKIPDHKSINILPFDLNSPAPIEDDQSQVESIFQLRPKDSSCFNQSKLGRLPFLEN